MKNLQTFEEFLNESLNENKKTWPKWFLDLGILDSKNIPYFYLGVNNKGEIVRSTTSDQIIDFDEEKRIIDYLVKFKKVDRQTIFKHNNHWTKRDDLIERLENWAEKFLNIGECIVNEQKTFQAQESEIQLAIHYIENDTNRTVAKNYKWLIDQIKRKMKNETGKNNTIELDDQEYEMINRFSELASKKYKDLNTD